MRTLGRLLTVGAFALVGTIVGAQQGSTVVTSLTVFAGSPSGLWRSRDWGGTWQGVERGRDASLESFGAARCVVALGRRVYVCGDGGVAVSDDFGETWKRSSIEGPVNGLLPSRYYQADPTVFAASAKGLSISSDGGLTFKETLLQGLPILRLEWPGPELVLATARGVLISTDAGKSFRGPGEGLADGEVGALALSSFFHSDPVAFAGVGRAGVFRSSDGGRTWTPAGLSGRVVNDLVWIGPLLYAATDGGVFRSEDVGRTWNPLGKELAGRDVTRLLFPLLPSSGAEVFAGTDEGIFRSSDGGLNWIRMGFPKERVLALGTFPPAIPGGKVRR